MNRSEAIEFLELVKVKLVDDESSIYYDEIREALDMAINALGYEVAYICDGKRCVECTSPECRHTLDIYYAKNFVEVEPDRWMENADNTEITELRERVDELEELLRDPSRISSSSYYTLGRL